MTACKFGVFWTPPPPPSAFSHTQIGVLLTTLCIVSHKWQPPSSLAWHHLCICPQWKDLEHRIFGGRWKAQGKFKYPSKSFYGPILAVTLWQSALMGSTQSQTLSNLKSSLNGLWILKPHCYSLVRSQFEIFLSPSYIFNICVVLWSSCSLVVTILFPILLDFENSE